MHEYHVIQSGRNKSQFLHLPLHQKEYNDHPVGNERLMQERSKPNILKKQGQHVGPLEEGLSPPEETKRMT
jgi:hypothetical protein